MNWSGVIQRAWAITPLLALVASAPAVQAQSKYPERPIRLIIPYAPGGATDIMGRKFAAHVGPLLGQNLIVNNKAGANGVIGTTEAARAKPDGYTLLVGTSSTHALNPTAMENPPYDPVKDFAPVAVLGIVPIVIAVHPSVPAKTLQELIAVVRKNPRKYSYGSSGFGSINHLAGELLQKQVPGFVIQHVPYKGSGPSAIDLIAGQIPLLISTFSSVSAYYKAGRLRILARVQRSAHGGEPGDSHRARKRRAGNARVYLQHHLRAGRHAAAGDRCLVSRDRASHTGQIISDRIARPWFRECGLQPRESRPLHQGGTCAMGADHQGDGRQARMTAPMPVLHSTEVFA
jgi:tripartite-type tricarboxylate transporter receptor subunit TctC